MNQKLHPAIAYGILFVVAIIAGYIIWTWKCVITLVQKHMNYLTSEDTQLATKQELTTQIVCTTLSEGIAIHLIMQPLLTICVTICQKAEKDYRHLVRK